MTYVTYYLLVLLPSKEKTIQKGDVQTAESTSYAKMPNFDFLASLCFAVYVVLFVHGDFVVEAIYQPFTCAIPISRYNSSDQE